jgi:hypothetical protein
MGDNEWAQSGNESYNKIKLDSIIKLNYFENKNLIIKKIVCGINSNVFLTGC